MSNKHFSNRVRNNGESKSLFSHIEDVLNINLSWDKGLPMRFLPKILFIMALGVFYIGNTHQTDKTIREINTLQNEVEDLRADYITLKADYMLASKQSKVARRVDSLGLKEGVVPPVKIVVDEDEY